MGSDGGLMKKYSEYSPAEIQDSLLIITLLYTGIYVFLMSIPCWEVALQTHTCGDPAI